MLEVPKIAGLTTEAQYQIAKPITMSSHDKMALAYSLIAR